MRSRPLATGLAIVAPLAVAGGFAFAREDAPARTEALVRVVPAGTVRHVATSRPSGRMSCRLRTRRFKTLPSFRPTAFCLAARRDAELPGDQLLVTPRPDPSKNRGEQFGLMMLDTAGRLLWYMPRPDKVHDLKTVSYRGRPALAFWEKHSPGGYYQLLDDHYAPVARVQTGGGNRTDMHELQVTPQGTAWVGANAGRRVRGHGTITDYVVQQVDIATGRVLTRWRALDHVPLRDSYAADPRGREPWDAYHGNAIDPPTAQDPTLIISLRNTAAVYGIDPATGRTRWILGGKRDQFGVARRGDTRFCMQHDARRLPNGDLSLFDNGGSDPHGPPACPIHPARGMVLRLDVEHRRARLVRVLPSEPMSRRGAGFLSGWVGSSVPASNGDMVVDWGQIPRVNIVGGDGRAKLLLRLKYWSYRAQPVRWTGAPPGAPAVVARRSGGNVDLWASWNGATRLASWQVLAGPSADAVTPIGDPVRFQDLETRIRARSDAPYVAVEARDASGAVLGRSAAVRVR